MTIVFLSLNFLAILQFPNFMSKIKIFSNHGGQFKGIYSNLRQVKIKIFSNHVGKLHCLSFCYCRLRDWVWVSISSWDSSVKNLVFGCIKLLMSSYDVSFFMLIMLIVRHFQGFRCLKSVNFPGLHPGPPWWGCTPSCLGNGSLCRRDRYTMQLKP